MSACMRIGDFQRHIEEPDAAVELHLAGCANCQAAFARVARTDRRVNTLLMSLDSPAAEMPVDVTAALARVACPQARDHVANLLSPDLAEIPWYVSLYRSVHELIRPERLPALHVTSRPVPVKEIWGLYAKDPKSRYLSLAVHAAVFTLLMIGATSPTVRQSVRERFDIVDPALKPFVPQHPSGGGGGGAKELAPVSRGQAPKPALKQFVPPQIVRNTPKLAIEPSIVLPPDAVLPQNNLANWGDPLARLSTLSNGPGSGGGMGTGSNGGLGSGKGSGYDNGEGGGFAGTVYTAGGRISRPLLLSKTDPEYSEEARKARFSGAVTLAIIVDTEGRVRDIRVIKSVGMGLDEKAREAVRQWRFKPGMKDGQPVNVRATVDVTFRLL